MDAICFRIIVFQSCVMMLLVQNYGNTQFHLSKSSLTYPYPGGDKSLMFLPTPLRIGQKFILPYSLYNFILFIN